MSGFKRLTTLLDNPTPSANHGGPRYPYIVHRGYHCGHPDEYIEVNEVQGSSPRRIQHCLIPPIEQPFCGSERAYQQTLERCRACARDFNIQKRLKNPRAIPRSLTAVQALPLVDDKGERDGFLRVLARLKFGHTGSALKMLKREESESTADARVREIYEKMLCEDVVKPHPRDPYESRVGNRTYDVPGGKSYIVEERVAAELTPTVSPRDSGTLTRPLLDDLFDETGISPGISRSLTQPGDDVAAWNRHPDLLRAHSLDSYGNFGNRADVVNGEHPTWPLSTGSASNDISAQTYHGDRKFPVETRGLVNRPFNRIEPPPSPAYENNNFQRPWGPVRESGGTTMSDPTMNGLEKKDLPRSSRSQRGSFHTPPPPRDHRQILKERLQRSPSSPLSQTTRGSRTYRQRGSGETVGSSRSQECAPGNTLIGERQGVQLNEEALNLLEGRPSTK